MKKTAALLGLAMIALLSPLAHASDPVGIYALVDKVTLEPTAENPERIQIHGKFAIADVPSGAYTPVTSGYLYYSIVDKQKTLCLNEWADLVKIAGTGQCVAFGSRHYPLGTVRTKTPATNPDVYPVEGHSGLTLLQADWYMCEVLKKAAVKKVH